VEWLFETRPFSLVLYSEIFFPGSNPKSKNYAKTLFWRVKFFIIIITNHQTMEMDRQWEVASSNQQDFVGSFQCGGGRP